MNPDKFGIKSAVLPKIKLLRPKDKVVCIATEGLSADSENYSEKVLKIGKKYVVEMAEGMYTEPTVRLVNTNFHHPQTNFKLIKGKKETV